jgi:cytochrome c oxidase subunit 4
MDTHSTNPPPVPHDPGQGSAHGADEHAAQHPPYFKIWFVLLVLTVLEVVFAVVTHNGMFKAVGLVAMALYKAVLVAAYFMHLKFEKRLMWVIAAAPLIFGVILAIGAYPDSEHSTDAKKHGELPERIESR